MTLRYENTGLLIIICPLIFDMKMSSAFYVYCIYSSALQTIVFHGSKHYGPRSDCSQANNMNPDQTAPEQTI